MFKKKIKKDIEDIEKCSELGVSVSFIVIMTAINRDKGTKILLITSCIYVPFQEMKFMRLAIDYGFEVDCIGSDIDYSGPSVLVAANYLQEVKATINAFYYFYHECKE